VSATSVHSFRPPGASEGNTPVNESLSVKHRLSYPGQRLFAIVKGDSQKLIFESSGIKQVKTPVLVALVDRLLIT